MKKILFVITVALLIMSGILVAGGPELEPLTF